MPASDLKNIKAAFVGGGHMASALIAGLADSGCAVHVADRNKSRRNALSEKYGAIATDRPSSLPVSDVLILAVRPGDMRAACEELPAAGAVVSVALGIPMKTLREWMPQAGGVARAMPNTPAAMGMGMTVCCGDLLEAAQTHTSAVFSAVGEVIWVEEESLVDAATAVSGCGPAYAYYMAEVMEEAAREMGFDEQAARRMAAQTLRGGGEMLRRSGESAETLRHAVAVKGGATEQAILHMQNRKVGESIKEAMGEALSRARQTAKEAAAGARDERDTEPASR